MVSSDLTYRILHALPSAANAFEMAIQKDRSPLARYRLSILVSWLGFHLGADL
jgi:hypothetical protein